MPVAIDRAGSPLPVTVNSAIKVRHILSAAIGTL
jgi:hypothetical protein